MRQLTVLAAAVVAITLANATPARAQLATTTFVSGDGLDTNPCTLAAPCRSFQHAHDMTAAGGQVTMLDPAGYGRLTITKAISIVNDGGGEAGITDPGSGSNAITINAGASDVVTLRGLTLNGVGTGGAGILFNSGGTLNIQHCAIRAFANNGVDFLPSASAAIAMSDTIVSNNADSGVDIGASIGTISMSLERVTAIGNGVYGFVVTGAIQGAIVDSAAIGNVADGFHISSGSAATPVALINSVAIRNQFGVTASGTTVMSRVTVAGNRFDGFVSGGGSALQTFGDNYLIDTTNSGTLSPIAEQ